MANQDIYTYDPTLQAAQYARQQKMAELMQQQADQPIDIQSYNGIQAPISWGSVLAKGLKAGLGSYLGGEAMKGEAALKNADLQKAQEYFQGAKNKEGPYTLPIENMPTTRFDKDTKKLVLNEPVGTQDVSLGLTDPLSGNPLMKIGGGAPRSLAEQRDYAEQAYFSPYPSVRALGPMLTARATPKFENLGARGAMDTNPDSPTYGQVIGAPAADKQTYKVQNVGGRSREVIDTPNGIRLGQDFGPATDGTNVTVKLPPGLNKADETLGEMYAKYITGDTASVKKNMNQLGIAINTMEAKPELFGNLSGALPVEVRSLFPGLKEGANVQQMVQDVVQTNLRQVLGSQFTEREGAGLMKRVLDPNQPTAVNVDRAKRLLKSIQEAAQAKQDTMQYFGKHNSISGYQPKYSMVGSVDDILSNAGLDVGYPSPANASPSSSGNTPTPGAVEIWTRDPVTGKPKRN